MSRNNVQTINESVGAKKERDPVKTLSCTTVVSEQKYTLYYRGLDKNDVYLLTELV